MYYFYKDRFNRSFLFFKDKDFVNKEDESNIEDVEKRNVMKKGSDKMSKTVKSALVTLKDQTKSDVNEVVYRKASKKLISGFRKLVLNALSSSELDSSVLTNVKLFLNTEYGEAVLSFLIGTVVPYIPNVNNNEKFLKLSEEMRINGLEVLFELVFSNTLMPVLTPILDELKTVELS